MESPLGFTLPRESLSRQSKDIPKWYTVPEAEYHKIQECNSLIKEGETPAECIRRHQKHTSTALQMYAKEKAKFNRAKLLLGEVLLSGILNHSDDKEFIDRVKELIYE